MQYFGRYIFNGKINGRITNIDCDENGEVQDSTDDVCVVIDGEIYNEKELSDYGSGDAEIVKAMYHLHSGNIKEIVKKLIGKFSIVIIDKVRDKIFLVRDHMGIQPIYYHVKDKEICFSGSFKSMLEHLDNCRNISVEGILSYLTYESVQEPFTIIDGIYMLPAGAYMAIDMKNISDGGNVVKYWNPVDSYVGYEHRIDNKDSFEEAGQKSRNLVFDAIEKCTAESSGNISKLAFCVSGGIDSTAVVAVKRCMDKKGGVSIHIQ